MTTARPTSTDDRIELSTSHGYVFFTASEISAIEDDPVLSLDDVAQHRAEGSR